MSQQRIEEIVARMKVVNDRQEEIERTCQLENEGTFTDAQRDEYRTLNTEYDGLKAEKKTLEDDAAMKAGRAGRAEDLQPRSLPRRTPDNSGAPHASARQEAQPIESNPDDQPRQRTFRIPANVRRFGSLKNFKGESNGQSAEERAYRFGQYCLAKISHDLPQRYQFRDATKFVDNYMGGIRNTAHGESDATTGGEFLVPTEFSSDLIVLRETYGVARRIFAIEPMGTDSRHVPKRASGLTAYFVGESSQITESNMTWSDIELVARKLSAIARISAELNADAVISVGDNLAGEIAYAFANKEDECAFNGDATSTYGHIMGVRARLQDVDGAGTDSAGLTTGAGNAYSELTLANFNSVVGTLPQYADTPRACWVCHKTFYHAVMQRLEMAAGGAQMMEIAQGDRRPRPLFMGYPVEFSQVMPSTEANSQVCVLLGDFTLGAILGDRAQTSIAFSEHATVNSTSVFEYDQIAVRGTERFAMVVHGYGTSSAAGPIVGMQTAGS